MNRHWHLREADARGLMWLGLDHQGHAVNLLALGVLDELESRLDELEPRLAADPIVGLVLHSLKETGFIAGADLGEFERLSDPAEAAAHIRRVHRILDRIESLPCPTLALIHGFCLGGGLELALACRYRVATDDPATRIGFPEIQLGLFPGYGGTWRAIRVLGPIAALRLMLTGRSLSGREAKALGLVDRVVPRRQLEATAADLARDQPRPGRAGWSRRLPNLWPLRPLIAARMEHQTDAKVVRAHYPAPFALIRHWRDNGSGRDPLLAGEARQVPELLLGETSRHLRRVFALQERLKGLASSTTERPRRVQVIGAGVMGGDIAAWCALQGMRVGLQDVSMEAIGRAMRRAQTLFGQRLSDPRLARDAWDRLTPDPSGQGLRGADLIIEAVAEDLSLKQRVFAEIEERAGPQALLATNTSSLPLERIGSNLRHPERLVGLHFFNPVARMRLVEVVRGADTDPDPVARAIAAVRAMDRLPLPVLSRPGFLVNRVLMPYLLEAVDLLDEGVPVGVIDRAAVAFGMPMGPLALADSVGLDICLAVSDTLGHDLTAPEETPQRLSRMVAEGLLGRKSGRGFYSYRDGRPSRERPPRGYRAPSDLTERLIFRLLNECVACLREGVVEDADLLDAGVILGTGFAPHTGGPAHYIAQGGRDRMRERLASLQRRHGGHFRPDRGWNPHPAGI
ncbi:3-hydroxyacyl-CoA dehydrogenase NAD-binding domain-containing protein [Thiocystis violacea]|uniref:3-hydroxyacyl-CoA dehydrogenase NAD-binding domain-containing protein n=1 Tax=Thiocystis violacea TaxID=13725 RepID=UPI001902CBCB|nr:3-hydroxyacyl-CoA dehydrogenase NAD-binding domain-containing protein [Thiocystis violacea]MBK1720364.1 crotonase [Thiocystis violacea]